MNLFPVCIILLTTLCVQGCSSKNNISKKKTEYRSDTTQMRSDTIPQPTPPQPGLSPGHAKIRGEIVSTKITDQDSGMSSLTIKVNKILGYGSSTPPIAVTDSIQVSSAILDEKDIQAGKFVSAVISYQFMLNDSSSSPRWRLVKFKKDSN